MSRGFTVSVLIPFLNASEDVEGVFLTLKNQVGIDKKSAEVVVVNDGSSDDTQQKIAQCKNLLKDFGGFQEIVHEKREGHVVSRLDAAKAAKGKFLVFVDKRTRPDPEYVKSLLGKKRNIVVGDVYTDKHRSSWDRVLTLVRKKLYFPYFNHPFEDIELDQEGYRLFKNKGGGGALLVLRNYYIQVVDAFKKSKDASDDTMLISGLLAIEPLIKTADARTLYINRTGFKENTVHLFNRGPKFVDYYINPETRFFPFIMGLVVVLAANLVAIIVLPMLLLYEVPGAITLLMLVAIYLSEEPLDFITCLWLFPVIFVIFVTGIIKGLAMKVLRLY